MGEIDEDLKRAALPWALSVVYEKQPIWPGNKAWVVATGKMSNGGNVVAEQPIFEDSQARWPENAKFIVKTANCHQKLVDVLIEILDELGDHVSPSLVEKAKLVLDIATTEE